MDRTATTTRDMLVMIRSGRRFSLAAASTPRIEAISTAEPMARATTVPDTIVALQTCGPTGWRDTFDSPKSPVTMSVR